MKIVAVLLVLALAACAGGAPPPVVVPVIKVERVPIPPSLLSDPPIPTFPSVNSVGAATDWTARVYIDDVTKSDQLRRIGQIEKDTSTPPPTKGTKP